MKPWVRLDTATVPGRGGELQRTQRDSEFSIMADAITRMNSRARDNGKGQRHMIGFGRLPRR